MVKRREKKQDREQPTEREIEAFASGVGGGEEDADPSLDPNAKRNYKAITLSLNKYEYLLLEDIAKKTGRSKLNLIRWGILRLSEETKKGY